ncbi:MAG: citrate lyase acyl carrier protein [Spirochaetales bacterium]|jgi:citrate lyase subunit gamma (acyl carrier protein)|nr:citrate lyase acyl carrier protein [Spirochaetales bacterium]
MDILKTGVAGTLESSDIMITVEPWTQGVSIDVQSIVEKQFGREIRLAIEETLSALRVKTVHITAVDKGALDCTIRARTKTAVYRANEKTPYEWKV